MITRAKKQKPYRLTAQVIELLLAESFDYRQNVIVPNVSWGMNLPYEADMVVLRKSGYAIEIEIKISAADIKADLQKRHQHDSDLFKELWFAVPEKLENHDHIPLTAGIISVYWDDRFRSYRARITRGAYINKTARKWDDKKQLALCRLGAIRTWPLKSHLIEQMKKRGANENK